MSLDSYQNKYIKQHSGKSFETYLTKIRIKLISDLLNSLKPQKVLEIGCGLYPLFQYYNDYKLYTIVERSKDFCMKIFSNDTGIRKSSRYIKIVCGDVEDNETIELMCEMQVKYDFIILSSVLHFFKEPEKVLNNIRNLCHEDTLIYINTPNAKSAHRMLGYHMGLIKNIHELSEMDIEFGQNSVYSLGLLKSLMEHCGFNEHQSGTYLIKPFSDKQMSEIINDDVLDGLYMLGEELSELQIGCELFYIGKLK